MTSGGAHKIFVVDQCGMGEIDGMVGTKKQDQSQQIIYALSKALLGEGPVLRYAPSLQLRDRQGSAGPRFRDLSREQIVDPSACSGMWGDPSRRCEFLDGGCGGVLMLAW